ncbi:hypothetical protein ACKSBH_002663 [Acinetobacter baumannii]|nr:hypothetical protein F9K57_17400 [Acinetobacter baumannii]HEM6663630.1 hypothetical protein [Acinetobacter baumannii]
MKDFNIIFHCPFPLNFQAKSASGIRPIKLLKAFQELGCNIDLVVGYSDERREAINIIKRKIEKGYKYNFVYSESSTMPTALTDTHHLPLHPFMDFNFFRFLKKNNIKIGLFYRDIHWKFDHYGLGLPWYKKQLALFFYYFDLKAYNKYIDVLYLPSLEMGKYIDFIDSNKFKALPPAHDISFSEKSVILTENINLLYVGGVGEGYKLHKLFDALKLMPEIQLTVCTRELDWSNAKFSYDSIPNNIRVVHESAEELDKLYKNADIGVLFVEPKSYWEFAVPFKLYEYIGRNKPIICCRDTLVGNIVSSNNIGWSIDYKVESLVELLTGLESMDIINKTKKILEFSKTETWKSRASKVINDLSDC